VWVIGIKETKEETEKILKQLEVNLVTCLYVFGEYEMVKQKHTQGIRTKT